MNWILKRSASFTLLAAIACGCATKKPAPVVELDQVGTKVYDHKKGAIPPEPTSPTDLYGNESYMTEANGAQPIIHQPQVMVIGQTPTRDPNNPNVYRGGRMDYVVIKDWEWNENALRRGSDIQIPDPSTDAGIEELTVVQENSAGQPPPVETHVAKTPEPTLSDDMSENTASPKANTVEKPLVQEETKDKQMELPAGVAPETFEAFLKKEGKNYYGLRKDLRTLGLLDKSDYDKATRRVGPEEQLGFLPNFGWTAFQIKNWNDLTEQERTNWLKDSKYQTFAAKYLEEQKGLRTEEARTAEINSNEGTRPQGADGPEVIEVDLSKRPPDGPSNIK